MAVNIIGISAFYHDSACCLIRDGHLVCAAEEERFSRIKHDNRLPVNAFLYCLKQGEIDITGITALAYYENPEEKLQRQIWMGLKSGKPNKTLQGRLGVLDTGVEETIREGLGYTGEIVYVDHHLSHAASSFYFSGFNEAAVMTVDAVGEWTTTGYGTAGSDGINFFQTVDFPHSLGLLYSTITAFLGFRVNNGEYKVMGLAPYGKPCLVDTLYKLISPGEQGQFRLNLDYFDFLGGERMYSAAFVDLLGREPRVPESAIEDFHMDLARSAQQVIEDILLEKSCWLSKKSKSGNLCLAGGVALNCVANGKILRQSPFEQLFVQPAANDAGGALGAAAEAYRQLRGERICQKRMEHTYLGPRFSNADIKKILDAGRVEAVDYSGRNEALLAALAGQLAAGKIVGWFHGPMEFGPRALGGRSILADPRDPAMRDRVNSVVKKRESFRPFAPVVLDEFRTEHFDLDHQAPFMLETCQVKSEIALPAITHVDGSARVQTINVQTNPGMAGLLAAFYRKTGCPVLLNTSFNVRGEPIVCSPVDAIVCFINSTIDILVLEDYVLDRQAVSDFWKLNASLQHNGGTGIRHDVYTLF